MAQLRYAAKFDPFLSLDYAPTPSAPAQSKERKGSNFAIWQHRLQEIRRYQKGFQLLIPRLPFARLVKEIAQGGYSVMS